MLSYLVTKVASLDFFRMGTLILGLAESAVEISMNLIKYDKLCDTDSNAW